jgi:uncharacterized DUF497 family protein
MRFEFDPTKSVANKAKHGIDFLEAQHLWDDEGLVVASARDKDQVRFMAIGKIDGRHWSAICTWRGEAIRFISVRRSRNAEVELYESR